MPPKTKGKRPVGQQDNERPREFPCTRCLHSLARWEAGSPPVCADDDTASIKCSHCRQGGKVCCVAVGPLKARGQTLKLTIKNNNNMRTNEVKAAQIAVAKCLQANKNKKSMSEVRKKEAKEAEEAAQEERRTLALEQIVTQLKGLNEQLKGLKKIKEEGHLLRSHFEKVYHSITQEGSEDDESGDEAIARLAEEGDDDKIQFRSRNF